MAQTKRVDPINLPQYPNLPQDPNMTQYFRALTQAVQWFGDQSQTAIDQGLVPYQSINMAVTISNGATGYAFTFSPALPAGTNYSVIPTLHWNGGAVWVTPTSANGATINWSVTPSVTSTIDFVVYLTQLYG